MILNSSRRHPPSPRLNSTSMLCLKMSCLIGSVVAEQAANVAVKATARVVLVLGVFGQVQFGAFRGVEVSVQDGRRVVRSFGGLSLVNLVVSVQGVCCDVHLSIRS